MKIIISLLFILFSSEQVFANCDQYGNCYSGSTGYNLRTGKTWTNNNTSQGSYGRVSRGNYWNYNRGTGSYYNYGTNERRYNDYSGQRRSYGRIGAQRY